MYRLAFLYGPTASLGAMVPPGLDDPLTVGLISAKVPFSGNVSESGKLRQNPESQRHIDTKSFVPFPLNYTESSYLEEISEKILPGNSNVPALGGCF